MKKMLAVLLVCAMALCVGQVAFAQEAAAPAEGVVEVVGAVEVVAEDGSSVVVAGQEVKTTPEFVEEAAIEVGDNVTIYAKDENGALVAVDYKYAEEAPVAEEAPAVAEEAPAAEEAPVQQ